MRAMAIAVLLVSASTAHAQVHVRTDRPRLLLSPSLTSEAAYRARCTTDPATMARCQSGISGADGSLWPAMAHAAGYVVNGDAAQCAMAFAACQTEAVDDPGTPDPHSFISNHGRTMADLAVTLDWCMPALDATQQAWLVTRISTYADWYVANSPGDVYHDDMNNVWNAVALAGLTLKGTSADAAADGYLTAASNQWKNVIIPAIAHAGDWWHEGFTYVQPTIGSFAWTLAAWTSATDEDLYAYARDHGDLVEGYLRFHAYALRPDDHYAYFGDTSDNKQSIELFSRPLVDMLTYGSHSTLGQGLSMYIHDHSRPGYDYAGANGWLLALLYDPSRDATATPLTALPTTRWLGRGSEDIAVLRSGWDANATYIMVSCGDYFSAHQHLESGSFQIFRKSILTGPSGYYDSFDTDHWWNYYSQHSVHANTLAIVKPGEYFPSLFTLSDMTANVNDGGERNLRMVEMGRYRSVPDLPTYMTRLTAGAFYETGSLATVEHGDCHDYVACDVTHAYSSPGYVTDGNTPKVSEVTRQLVFLHPDTIVVFDRVDALDASFEKRFLLHTTGTPTTSAATFSWANGAGRLAGQTVLPAMADTTVVNNFEVAGTSHAPSTTGMESGGTRVEVSPHAESTRDYFLHVLTATDSGATSTPSATLMAEDASTVTIAFDYSGGHVVLRFAKTGTMAGHLTVSGGATACDTDLGSMPLPPPDGGVPGADGGAHGDGGIGVDGGRRVDGGPGSGAGGGCCATVGRPVGSPFAFSLLVLGTLGLRMRVARRRAR